MKPLQLVAAGISAVSLGACAGLFGSQERAAGQAQPQAAARTVAVSAGLVRNAQLELDARGIDAGPVDGIYGPQTQQGVQQFQRKQGLEPTGELNARTLAALGIGSGESASAGGTGGQPQADRPRFENLDANDDGELTLAEAGADTRVSRDFRRADKNQDWRLTREEFETALRMDAQ